MIGTSDTGFFKSYYNNLKSTIGKDVMQNFGALESDQERFRLLSEVVATPERCLRITWVQNGKDVAEAGRLKERGNQSFSKNNNEEALSFYTDALLRLPQTAELSSDMAVILANRSASLYHLNEYELAIRDINEAISLGYPKNLRYKISERKAKCLLAMKKHSEAIEEFRNTLHAVDDSKLPSEKKLKMQTDIQIMLRVMTTSKTSSGLVTAFKEGQPISNNKKPEPKLASRRHNVYTAGCDKIDIHYDPVLGRYAVAAENIGVGEVLLVEKPFCSVLLAEFARTHCLHCFNRTKAPYPCRNCVSVVFCSKECQKMAETSYHKYECSILDTVYSSGASVTVLMALRIITEKSLSFFLDKKKALSETRKEFTVYDSSDYEALYHLVRHENLRKVDDFFERTVMAYFLLQCLRKAAFFPNSNIVSENLTEDECFIGGLILRHLQLLQFNAHEIFEVELKRKTTWSPPRSVFIGGGVYLTLSLFNHSCDPGVVRYFRGSTVVVRAIKNIRKGDIIAENYGPMFTTTRREERRERLKSQYWFDCGCIACSENWPTFDDMDTKFLRFRCDVKSDDGQIGQCNNVILVPQSTDEFVAKCSSCGQLINLLKKLKTLQDTDAMYHQASKDADAGKYESALEKNIKTFSILDSIMAPPFRDYYLCQQAIRNCMICFGNEHIQNS